MSETNAVSEHLEHTLELQAFMEFRHTGKIPLKYAIPLGIKALLTDIPDAVIRFWPGAVGMKLRQWYFGATMEKVGKGVIFETGIHLVNPANIAISDFVLIDRCVSLNALGGRIEIGRRIHIAPYAIISGAGIDGQGGVFLGDYAAVGAFARIYSHSEAVVNGKLMSGPMIPEESKGMITAPVRIGKDGLIGTGAVILPGVTVSEGAIIAANSFVPANMLIP